MELFAPPAVNLKSTNSSVESPPPPPLALVTNFLIAAENEKRKHYLNATKTAIIKGLGESHPVLSHLTLDDPLQAAGVELIPFVATAHLNFGNDAEKFLKDMARAAADIESQTRPSVPTVAAQLSIYRRYIQNFRARMTFALAKQVVLSFPFSHNTIDSLSAHTRTEFADAVLPHPHSRTHNLRTHPMVVRNSGISPMSDC